MMQQTERQHLNCNCSPTFIVSGLERQAKELTRQFYTMANRRTSNKLENIKKQTHFSNILCRVVNPAHSFPACVS